MTRFFDDRDAFVTAFGSSVKPEEFSTLQELRDAIQSLRDSAGFDISEDQQEMIERYWEENHVA